MNQAARAVAARVRAAPAHGDDPDVRACMERYLTAWGFPLDSGSSADRWTRFAYGDEVIAVAGELVGAVTGSVHIVDLYPGMGRNGILGVYAVVEVLKHLVDRGAIERVTWISAVDNRAHTAALKRILRVEPLTYFWCYGSLPPQAESHSSYQGEPHESPDAEKILGVGSAALDRAFQEVFGDRQRS
jgi:hypothetical protein